MFVDDAGAVLTTDHRLAELLRESLWTAEVRRSQLHNDTTNSRKLRAHDLRATFTTLALAVGKTESWVKDRTGWTSSTMLERYRRAAHSAAERTRLACAARSGHSRADGRGNPRE
jgi:integrase